MEKTDDTEQYGDSGFLDGSSAELSVDEGSPESPPEVPKSINGGSDESILLSTPSGVSSKSLFVASAANHTSSAQPTPNQQEDSGLFSVPNLQQASQTITSLLKHPQLHQIQSLLDSSPQLKDLISKQYQEGVTASGPNFTAQPVVILGTVLCGSPLLTKSQSTDPSSESRQNQANQDPNDPKTGSSVGFEQETETSFEFPGKVDLESLASLNAKWKASEGKPTTAITLDSRNSQVSKGSSADPLTLLATKIVPPNPGNGTDSDLSSSVPTVHTETGKLNAVEITNPVHYRNVTILANKSTEELRVESYEGRLKKCEQDRELFSKKIFTELGPIKRNVDDVSPPADEFVEHMDIGQAHCFETSRRFSDINGILQVQKSQTMLMENLFHQLNEKMDCDRLDRKKDSKFLMERIEELIQEQKLLRSAVETQEVRSEKMKMVPQGFDEILSLMSGRIDAIIGNQRTLNAATEHLYTRCSGLEKKMTVFRQIFTANESAASAKELPGKVSTTTDTKTNTKSNNLGSNECPSIPFTKADAGKATDKKLDSIPSTPSLHAVSFGDPRPIRSVLDDFTIISTPTIIETETIRTNSPVSVNHGIKTWTCIGSVAASDETNEEPTAVAVSPDSLPGVAVPGSPAETRIIHVHTKELELTRIDQLKATNLQDSKPETSTEMSVTPSLAAPIQTSSPEPSFDASADSTITGANAVMVCSPASNIHENELEPTNAKLNVESNLQSVKLETNTDISVDRSPDFCPEPPTDTDASADSSSTGAKSTKKLELTHIDQLKASYLQDSKQETSTGMSVTPSLAAAIPDLSIKKSCPEPPTDTDGSADPSRTDAKSTTKLELTHIDQLKASNLQDSKQETSTGMSVTPSLAAAIQTSSPGPPSFGASADSTMTGANAGTVCTPAANIHETELQPTNVKLIVESNLQSVGLETNTDISVDQSPDFSIKKSCPEPPKDTDVSADSSRTDPKSTMKLESTHVDQLKALNPHDSEPEPETSTGISGTPSLAAAIQTLSPEPPSAGKSADSTKTNAGAVSTETDIQPATIDNNPSAPKILTPEQNDGARTKDMKSGQSSATSSGSNQSCENAKASLETRKPSKYDDDAYAGACDYPNVISSPSYYYGGPYYVESRNSCSSSYSYGTTTKKHEQFVSESIRNKPIDSVPGIGRALGGRLKSQGMGNASSLTAAYRRHQDNPEGFANYMKNKCGANSRQAGDAFKAFQQRSKSGKR